MTNTPISFVRIASTNSSTDRRRDLAFTASQRRDPDRHVATGVRE
jgi:hypothetical protein